MTAHRVLWINASSTAVSAVAMLAARAILPPVFGLETPLVLDLVAIVFLAYAAAIAFAASRSTIDSRILFAFAAADGACAIASAAALVLFWPQLTIVGRLLLIALGLTVEVFAALQYRLGTMEASRAARVV
jgi:hypothetical protein